MATEKCNIAQATKDHSMTNPEIDISYLIKKRNKMVYTVSVLLILLTVLSFARYFFNFSVLYFLILLIPFFILVYRMIGITEDIRNEKILEDISQN